MTLPQKVVGKYVSKGSCLKGIWYYLDRIPKLHNKVDENGQGRGNLNVDTRLYVIIFIWGFLKSIAKVSGS